jgi:heme/copper-type cytochrome/quinol oxidase subunit 1
MPRRILDYPDTFLYYNSMASLGSFISFLSIITFLMAISNRSLYILPNLTSYHLDDAIQINRYHHLHSFNTVPVLSTPK